MPVALPQRRRGLPRDIVAICALGLALIAAVLAPEFSRHGARANLPQAAAAPLLPTHQKSTLPNGAVRLIAFLRSR